MTGSAQHDHKFAKADGEETPIAFNLSAMPWHFGVGDGANERSDWRLESAAGSETMFAQHLLGELRKNLGRVEEDEGFRNVIQRASERHHELVTILPREGRLRHEAFTMLEQSIDNRMGAKLRRFTSIKMYLNQEPSSTRNCVRKFKGGNSIQVVVNLSEHNFRFFRFHGKQHEDIGIDSMLPAWSDDPDEHVAQLESEIRMFDMAYFRRIREATESGSLYLLMPRGPKRRENTMRTFRKILERVPTGSIDLTNARIRRIYPGLTKTGEVH